VNVDSQSGDPESLLSFYRKMLATRKGSSALRLGDYELLDARDKDVLFFKRTFAGKEVYVLMNMSARAIEIDLKSANKINKVILSNDQIILASNRNQFNLAPYQGILFD